MENKRSYSEWKEFEKDVNRVIEAREFDKLQDKLWMFTVAYLFIMCALGGIASLIIIPFVLLFSGCCGDIIRTAEINVELEKRSDELNGIRIPESTYKNRKLRRMLPGLTFLVIGNLGAIVAAVASLLFQLRIIGPS